MFVPRALVLLTAALSTTAAAVGTVNVVNNCAYTITAATSQDATGVTLQSQFSISSGGSASGGDLSTEGWHIKMWKGTSAGILGFETRVEGDIVYYDVYEYGGSHVGDAFSMSSTDAACHAIQGGQCNFDIVQPDLYTCTSDASFTLTLCP